MGNVDTGVKALVGVMEGRTFDRGAALLRVLNKGTKNQQYMAAAALFHSTEAAERLAGQMRVHELLTVEESSGPRPWELLCPDPHEGMYLLARMGVIAAGGALGERMVRILSQELVIADLVASPDGDCRGIPGMRAPAGSGISRRALSACWIEVRRRQGAPVVHRGTGGRRRDLVWKPGKSDGLNDGAAYWLKTLLDADSTLLRRLSRDQPLPPVLRLGLKVWRSPSGTVAALDDPGPERRREFVVHGSAAARRDQGDHDEDPASWVQVEWVAPARHRVAAGECWETAPPEPPAGSKSAAIPGKGRRP